MEKINTRLDLIGEVFDLIKFDGGPPSLEFGDLGERLESASLAGTIIEPKELLEYAAFFDTVFKCQKIKSKYSKLSEMVSHLVYPQTVHERVLNSIDHDGEIKDSASPELKRIRFEFRQIKTKLDQKFEKYLQGATAAYLSDNIFTLREGRYVLPVREGDKGQVKGIIHDRSSSGATFFIEPSETVELNNRHRELETEERGEINRILRNLSEMLYINLDAVKTNIAILARFDFISACGRLAIELNASRPKFSESRQIQINNGKHPLLYLHFKNEPGREVVPISISLSPDANIMIITGPNTGGKTVALKTFGLLSIMASSGLFVSADDDSTFVIFNDIFADIGDEQSIDTSLSTYSSHLNHIKHALDNANSDTLVLFDELGAGTDPEEGSAIGQSIIEMLSKLGSYSIITTHHGKLKALAGKVEGVVNGSMEFDTENLAPSYKFQAGVPGSSFAVQIAKKLGLPDEITTRALELTDKKEQDLTNLITELNQKFAEITREKEEAEKNRLKYESLVQIHNDKVEAQKQQEKEFRKKQLKKTEEIINEARKEIESLLQEAKRNKKNVEGVRKISKTVSGKLQSTRQGIKDLEPPVEGEPARGLPGELVYVVGIDAEGEVIEPADSVGRVKIRVGNITMLTDLNKLLKRKQESKKLETTVKTDYTPEPTFDLDIRGMTFEEAEPSIQRYIDDASNAGLHSVSIIHGKGTGALRKKVQEYLRHNYRVESFRLGNWDEGSSGVTVVSLKPE
jgi:DNA mismatch repair protein MutS2